MKLLDIGKAVDLKERLESIDREILSLEDVDRVSFFDGSECISCVSNYGAENFEDLIVIRQNQLRRQRRDVVELLHEIGVEVEE